MKRLRREDKRRVQRFRANLVGVAVPVIIFAAGVLIGSAMHSSIAHDSATGQIYYTQVEKVRVFDRGESCTEDEDIDLALLRSGYYRDDIPMPYELQAVLRGAVEANEIPYNVALGLIEVESSFDPNAVSEAGCYGYMQLNPDYFPSDLSPEENIVIGISFLAYQLDRYSGDMAAALTAYNAGYE